MTPEERVLAALELARIDNNAVAWHLTKAVKAAVAEERERAARIVEQDLFDDCGIQEGDKASLALWHRAEKIAAKIRKIHNTTKFTK